MKRTGPVAAALAALMMVACNGNARNGTNQIANDANQTANDTTQAARDAARSTGDTVGTTGEKVGDLMPGSLQRFVHDVSTANMAEIELGKLAASRGQSADVKQFGQMMVTDHTKAGDELKQALTGSRYEVATQLDDKHNDLMTKLRGMQGAAFDREYMKAMVDGHQDVKGMLDGRADEKPNNDATENAVNAWAKKTLPAVEAHLDKAKQIRDKIDAAYRNTTN